MTLSSALVRALVHPGMLSVAAISGMSLGGCGGAPETGAGGGEDETVTTVSEALVGNPIFDDSASPVHVVGAICATPVTTPALAHTLDCTLPAGYVMVGGGASTEFENRGAITASFPLSDGKTWRASSRTPTGITQTHRLVTQVYGIRLDGVSTATLRNMIISGSVTVPPVPQGSSSPSLSMGLPPFAFGGGAAASTNGSGGQFLTQLMVNGGSWNVASRDFITSSPGWITGTIRGLATTGIIEGFGAIELQRKNGMPQTNNSAVEVTEGWGLAGLGGVVTTTAGSGRLLYRLAMGTGPRLMTAVATSSGKSGGQGSVTVQITEVRKTPNSHGMCNPGPPLATGMDSCVASICASDSFCCNNWWDALCVNEVSSICGRSCADASCSVSSFTPSFWNTGGAAQTSNSSYNYANNRRTDTNAFPGRAAGGGGAVADGLIPSTLGLGCLDQRSLVFFATKTNGAARWYRRDISGTWSYKPDGGQATDRDSSGNIIQEIEHADRGEYVNFGNYFCTCSSSTEGSGHAVIN